MLVAKSYIMDLFLVGLAATTDHHTYIVHICKAQTSNSTFQGCIMCPSMAVVSKYLVQSTLAPQCKSNSCMSIPRDISVAAHTNLAGLAMFSNSHVLISAMLCKVALAPWLQSQPLYMELLKPHPSEEC